jgi:hypothetical protein
MLHLRINPQAGQLTLRTPTTESAQLLPQELAHVSAALVAEAGANYLDISTTDNRLVVDG